MGGNNETCWNGQLLLIPDGCNVCRDGQHYENDNPDWNSTCTGCALQEDYTVNLNQQEFGGNQCFYYTQPFMEGQAPSGFIEEMCIFPCFDYNSQPQENYCCDTSDCTCGNYYHHGTYLGCGHPSVNTGNCEESHMDGVIPVCNCMNPRNQWPPCGYGDDGGCDPNNSCDCRVEGTNAGYCSCQWWSSVTPSQDGQGHCGVSQGGAGHCCHAGVPLPNGGTGSCAQLCSTCGPGDNGGPQHQCCQDLAQNWSYGPCCDAYGPNCDPDVLSNC